MKVTFAIVGKPNVGKSTLFNRLVGRRHALVDDHPGVTRDFREGAGRLADLIFNVVDTAGLEEAIDGSLEDRMRRQTETAITDSDITLMLVDAKAGITPTDKFFANQIRKSGALVILVANKCEGKSGVSGLADAWSLGLGEPIPISAVHGEGMVDLYNAFLRAIKSKQTDPGAEKKSTSFQAASPKNVFEKNDTFVDKEEPISDWLDGYSVQPMRIAVVGRPNMGKSTLINNLTGKNRLLSGPEAGITRDSIEVPFSWEGKSYRFVDTAGMRRNGRISQRLEKLMVADAKRAIQYAHLCILLLDATEPIHRQDLAIAKLIEQEGRALVIGANKWDLVSKKSLATKRIADRLKTSLAQLRGLPVIQVSALQKRGFGNLLSAADRMYTVWNKRISTGQLNRWLEMKLEAHPPPLCDGRRLRIRYITQIKTRPPTFALFASRPGDFEESYIRYLTSGLREDFGLAGVPIRMVMRKRENPFV